MPFGKWNRFEDCVRDFISQGKDEESARRICGALKARLEKEDAGRVFSLEGDIGHQRGNLIHGKAIHPIKTFHPEEWPTIRVYLEEELKKAAGSLVGAPLLLDHVHPLDGRVLDAKYEDGAVEYVAELNDETAMNLIKNGTIRHCSVEYDWNILTDVNGWAPREIQFTGLALLKDFEPGDPLSSVEVWERIIQKLKESTEKVGGVEKLNKQDLEKSEAQKEAEALQKQLAILSDQKKALAEALKASEEKVKTLANEKAELTKKLGEAVIDPSAKPHFSKEYVHRKWVIAKIESIIPSPQIVRSHGQTGGFRRLVDNIKRAKWEIETEEI